MGVVSIKHRGDFKNTERFLVGYSTSKLISVLTKYGRIGVDALAAATPVDTGLTANSWDFEIHISKSSFSLIWTNNNLTRAGASIAVLLQYGHGTKSGGYVQGRDYINPAIAPVFDDIAAAVWQEVSRL